MKLILIHENKKEYLNLLLLGDEQETMIDLYLERGDLFVLEDSGIIKGVCVVTNEGINTCELKNIAIHPNYQRQGYGKAMLSYLYSYYKNEFLEMKVGTGESPSTLAFYKKCGFTYSHRIKDFFIQNYNHPIFEDGILLADMIYFKKSLKN